MTYSVWYYSNPALGSIQESEGPFDNAEDAFKWFDHHTHNVSANMGWTQRVIITDSDDYIIAEWKLGEGITWPKEEPKYDGPADIVQYPTEDKP